MKEIHYRSAAQRSLERMPRNWAKRIRSKLQQYAADPQSLANNVKTLSDGMTLRLRVGDWRVLMQDGVVLDITEIGPRSGIYE